MTCMHATSRPVQSLQADWPAFKRGPSCTTPCPLSTPLILQVSAYSLSWFISELPYVFLLVALHVNVFYWLCGYSGDWYRFLFFW